jgi:hypothetical protein
MIAVDSRSQLKQNQHAMSKQAYHIDACKITQTTVEAECPFCTEYYKKNGVPKAKPRVKKHEWGLDPSDGIYGSAAERAIVRVDHCLPGRFPSADYNKFVIHIYPNTRRVKARKNRA